MLVHSYLCYLGMTPSTLRMCNVITNRYVTVVHVISYGIYTYFVVVQIIVISSGLEGKCTRIRGWYYTVIPNNFIYFVFVDIM